MSFQNGRNMIVTAGIAALAVTPSLIRQIRRREAWSHVE